MTIRGTAYAEISIEFARIYPNIKLIQNDGIGLPAALNCGAKAAKGQLIARMDSDICLKKRLSEQVKRFRLNDRLAILGSSAVIVESDGKISGHHLAFPSPLVELLMLYECSLIHPSVMMRREVFEFVGAYNVEYKSAQDYELWLRALFDGLRFDNVTQPLIVLRKEKVLTLGMIPQLMICALGVFQKSETTIGSWLSLGEVCWLYLPCL